MAKEAALGDLRCATSGRWVRISQVVYSLEILDFRLWIREVSGRTKIRAILRVGEI